MIVLEFMENGALNNFLKVSCFIMRLNLIVFRYW